MATGAQTAVFDDYLETKMRSVLEALVEALLNQKPDDVQSFCLDWLIQWQADRDPEKDLVATLRAERDLTLDKRNALLHQLSLVSPPRSPHPESEQASRPDSAPSTRANSFVHRPPGREQMGSPTWEEDQGVVTAADEAREQEKIRHMKDKDRRAGVSAQAISQERLKDWRKPFHEKSEEARARLKKIVDTNEKLQVLFGHLPDEHIFDVIDAMHLREVPKGEPIIRQGEEGDNFYIVDEGTFDVLVQRGEAAPGKVTEYGPGGMFGELALMYNAKRAATVTSTSEAKLWALDRESFQMMLTTAENTKKKQYEGFLESVEILQDLTKYELSRLSDMLESEVFDTDEAIINQGDAGNYFYILEEGEAKAYIGGEHGEIEVKHYQHRGEFFGEIALLKSATRKATVRAAGRGCSVLSVSREDFDLVLGPIKDILAKNINKYPQYADFIREEEDREKHEKKEREKIDLMKDSSRRQGVSAPAVSEERMKAWEKPYFQKDQQVRERIKKVIEQNEKLQVLFGHLSDNSVLDVIDAMAPLSMEKGSKLITQGEAGDNFYIVDDGTFDAFVQRGDNPPGKVCEYSPGAMFGELALMYNAPRAATVVATSPAKVWALDRESFQMMLSTAENMKKAQYEEFLSNIGLFTHLTRYELAQLSDMLESELYESGEDIVMQGDLGNYFYIIDDGEAKAFINGERGEIEVKHYTNPGEMFGEVALITNAVRRATVRATGTGCSVLSVRREDFDRVLGPIKDIMEKNIELYPAYADLLKELGSPRPGPGSP